MTAPTPKISLTKKSEELDFDPGQLFADDSEAMASLASRWLHNNPPQLTINAVDAATTLAIWGRNSGKTETVLAPWLYRRVKRMPRGTSALVSTTYSRLLTMVLPALMRGWQRLGLEENVHYFVGKKPDAELGIDAPYRNPASAQHCIFWWNGGVTQLVSLDRGALANGLRTQAIACDECRLYDYTTFAESILPTFGGNQEHFGHLYDYCAICMVTDMPRDPAGKWLFDYDKQMNEALVGAILFLSDKVSRLKLGLQEATGRAKSALESKIERWEEWLGKLRARCVMVSYASTLDNIHTVPLKTLLQYLRTLSKTELDFSVLNKKLVQVEDCFYSTLKPSRHGYYKENYDFIDRLPRGSQRNWRWDGDIDASKGLDISFDYNNRINTLIVGQLQGGVGRLLNHLYVLKPKLLRHLVDKFDKYYEGYPVKKVRFIYDHTAQVTSADDNETFSQKVEKRLTELGWKVTKVYTGQASEHNDRHQMWEELLDGKKDMDFAYNRGNCIHWQVAAQQTPIKRIDTKDGRRLKKDKSSEKSKIISPFEATHVTEAADGLVIYWLKSFVKSSMGAFFGHISG